MADLPEIILVPVDGSRNANAAAAYAGRLAEKLETPVRLLYAFPETPIELLGWPKESDRVEDLEYFSSDRFEKLRDDASRAAFDAARQAMGSNPSVLMEEQLLAGKPSKAILEHVGGVRNAILVIGRRGLSQVGEMVMGSTTQRVLHHAKCPVLVIQ